MNGTGQTVISIIIIIIIIILLLLLLLLLSIFLDIFFFNVVCLTKASVVLHKLPVILFEGKTVKMGPLLFLLSIHALSASYSFTSIRGKELIVPVPTGSDLSDYFIAIFEEFEDIRSWRAQNTYLPKYYLKRI